MSGQCLRGSGWVWEGSGGQEGVLGLPRGSGRGLGCVRWVQGSCGMSLCVVWGVWAGSGVVWRVLEENGRDVGGTPRTPPGPHQTPTSPLPELH